MIYLIIVMIALADAGADISDMDFASTIVSLATNAVMIGCNNVYFKMRARLFVN